MSEAGLWESFNWVDLVLGVGLLAALLVGFGMGFYRQLAIIASLVVGWVMASQLTGPLARSSFFEPVHARYGSSGAEFLAYTAIVLGALVVGLLSILIFRSFFDRTVRIIDSFLGGATGLVIGSLLFGLGILGLFHWEETWLHGPLRQSYLGSHLAEGARVASGIFPEDFRQRVEAGLSERISTIAGSPAEPAPAGAQADTPSGER